MAKVKLICENASKNGQGVSIKPQCWDNQAEVKATVFYINCIGDVYESVTVYLCKECTKYLKKLARKYGFKVRTTKL
ncbi:MAG: hypothetical protein C0169_02745 [Thermodesulfobacterium geofontis]|uniref:Uncharacterized protein n=1 Tax=Thermodesulfobacterium geofontis TaxID=1295609 RepID=A0A2N7QFD1_9BACT|nr:MAG: hypothetical protein C0169_02745 [Thermodesulfobacterium geofontis]